MFLRAASVRPASARSASVRTASARSASACPAPRALLYPQALFSSRCSPSHTLAVSQRRSARAPTLPPPSSNLPPLAPSPCTPPPRAAAAAAAFPHPPSPSPPCSANPQQHVCDCTGAGVLRAGERYGQRGPEEPPGNRAEFGTVIYPGRSRSMTPSFL